MVLQNVSFVEKQFLLCLPPSVFNRGSTVDLKHILTGIVTTHSLEQLCIWFQVALDGLLQSLLQSQCWLRLGLPSVQWPYQCLD